MRPQRFEFGDRVWPEGLGVLQVYALVDLAVNREFADLIGKCRAAVRGAPVVEVGDRLLHVTLDVIGGRTSDVVSQAERDVLVSALRGRLSRVPVYEGSGGSCLAYASGVVVDISPAAPLIEVQNAVREVIREVCGATACTWSQPKPHISTHYCHEATDSDPWQRRLRKIDPNHAPLRITSVALVDVRPDLRTKQLDWRIVASPIPLAGVPGRS